MAKKTKLLRLHKHHTIGFDRLDKIEWHLNNLWNGGYNTIREMKPREHIKHHSKKK